MIQLHVRLLCGTVAFTDCNLTSKDSNVFTECKLREYMKAYAQAHDLVGSRANEKFTAVDRVQSSPPAARTKKAYQIQENAMKVLQGFALETVCYSWIRRKNGF